jgi:hypothetical protein
MNTETDFTVSNKRRLGKGGLSKAGIDM